jgi:hypothetical protein
MTKEFPNDPMTNALFTEEFGTGQLKKSFVPIPGRNLTLPPSPSPRLCWERGFEF